MILLNGRTSDSAAEIEQIDKRSEADVPRLRIALQRNNKWLRRTSLWLVKGIQCTGRPWSWMRGQYFRGSQCCRFE